jgi:hypothetical protein
MDALLDSRDLCPDSRILASKDVEAKPRCCLMLSSCRWCSGCSEGHARIVLATMIRSVAGLLFDFERQPPPSSRHIDQYGLHSQIRGAFSRPFAFDSMLSALDGRNHRRIHDAPSQN